LPASLRRGLSDSLLRDIASDVRSASQDGGFDRDSTHISRTAMELDEEGWDALSTLLADVQQRAREIQEQSSKRREGSDAEAIRTALVLMQFECAGTQRSRS
ncbi:MAG: hypothetical protein QOE77_4080, partial [Blastocatellia bacterium]|nr:hypothetical protein [Blastocatellia bacterium]